MTVAKKPLEQLALPAKEAALATLNEVYNRVLFSKLASAYGLVPETPEQAGAVLETVVALRQVANDPAVKQASARQDPYLSAAADLRKLLGKSAAEAEPNRIKPSAAEVKQAAYAYTSHPDVYQAVLGLAAANAQER